MDHVDQGQGQPTFAHQIRLAAVSIEPTFSAGSAALQRCRLPRRARERLLCAALLPVEFLANCCAVGLLQSAETFGHRSLRHIGATIILSYFP
jgi:hypothetical protein